MKRILIGGLFAASLAFGAAGAAQAQSGAAAIPPVSDDVPTTGGSPSSTGSISSTGRTKPPGAPVGEGLGTRPDLERRAEELDRRIKNGICRGC